MNTIEIPDKNLTINIPSDWDEMSHSQRNYILQQATLLTSGNIDLHTFKIRCFYKLAGIVRDWRTLLWERFAPAWLLEDKNANASINAEKLTSFLLVPNEKDKRQAEINFDTVVNHYPVLNAGTKYYGPEDLLQDLTYGEFTGAIEYMNQYFQDKNTQTLDKMIACLYRPAGGDPDHNGGRIREPFNKHRIKALAKPLKKLKHWQRLAVLLWFTWCIKCLQVEDLIINSRKINLSPLFPGAGKKEKTGDKPGAGLGWTSVLFNLAKEQALGDIEKIEKTDFFDVLLFMYDNHLQQKRNKKK